MVSLGLLIFPAVDRIAIRVQLERKAQRCGAQSAVLEPDFMQNSGNVMKNLDVVLNGRSIVLWCNDYVSKNLAVNRILSVLVCQLGSRSEN